MAKDDYSTLKMYEINTLKSFVKIKGNSLNIGKVLFSFVEFNPETKKSIRNIDIYVDVDEIMLLCNDILSGRLAALAKNGDSKPLFQSLGGVNEEKCKLKQLRSDGNALSRSMVIQTGTKYPFIISAEIRAGHSNKQGLIVPDYKAPSEGKVSVACDNNTIKKMAIMVNSYINAYITREVNNFKFYGE